MSKIYKDSDFQKWQKKSGLTDLQLVIAVKEIDHGLYEAKIGDIYKKRIARPGMGKSGGWRVLVACKVDVAWLFIYGFSKNELDDIDNKTRTALREYVNTYLLPNRNKLINSRELFEVTNNEK